MRDQTIVETRSVAAGWLEVRMVIPWREPLQEFYCVYRRHHAVRWIRRFALGEASRCAFMSGRDRLGNELLEWRCNWLEP